MDFDTNDLIIRAFIKDEAIPYKLLLLADPSKKQISSYFKDSLLFVGEINKEIVGVYVLKVIDNSTGEIMNIAVAESYQRLGIGSKLLNHAIDIGKKTGLKKLVIGTADSSIYQLELYKKYGFNKFDKIENFFIQNYAQPIFENGVQARHMIRLVKIL